MTARPIIFSAPMVRALLEGRKTQTRRVLKPQPLPQFHPDGFLKVGTENATGRSVWEARNGGKPAGAVFPGPPGSLEVAAYTMTPGDRLWVREAWRSVEAFDTLNPAKIATECLEAGYRHPWAPIAYEVDARRVNWAQTWWHDHKAGRLRPSIHMPRWASRLTLTVTNVRVEQLQNISERDALAEGMTFPHGMQWGSHPRDAFHGLWNSLHGPDAWAANPWAVAISFTVEHGNIDAVPARAA